MDSQDGKTYQESLGTPNRSHGSTLYVSSQQPMSSSLLIPRRPSSRCDRRILLAEDLLGFFNEEPGWCGEAITDTADS